MTDDGPAALQRIGPQGQGPHQQRYLAEVWLAGDECLSGAATLPALDKTLERQRVEHLVK
jgi:hypothetical protein